MVSTKIGINKGIARAGCRSGRIPVREPSLRLRLATLPGKMVPVTGTATPLAPLKITYEGLFSFLFIFVF